MFHGVNLSHVPRMALSGLFLVASSCAVGPDYVPPDPQLPDQWHQPAAPSAAQVQEWWRVFGDQNLSELIEQAAAGNLDLRLAVLRIREARALRGVAAGELLPSLGGQGAYQRSKGSANGPLAFPQAPGKAETFANTVGRGVAGSALGAGLAAAAPGASVVTGPLASGVVGLIPSPSGAPDTDEINLHSAGFDASWEIDVFGGIRRNIEAADAELAAAVEDYRTVLVSLLAEVAATYIDVRSLQSQIEATRQNIQLQQQALALTRARFDAQLEPELDIRQAETNLATTESQLPLLETALTTAIYRLSVLTGRTPAALYDELSVAQPIPEPPAEALVGVPAEIVRRRPDIRAAERRLAAQTARVGVATADLYPRFSLAGTFGFEATDANHLFNGRSISYGFGPGFAWSILEGLRNLNRIAAQQAATHQAYVLYERTLLQALQDVESSSVAFTREQVRRAALVRATEAGRRSAHLAETLYQDGLTDFQNVLDAQRTLAALEISLAQSRGQVAIHLVALYKALGGGWSPQVMPQRQFLEDPDDVLADPLEFYFSGGKGTPSWVTPAADTTRTAAGPIHVE
ncbi:MAG: hypothetical protein AMXMBFR13_43130 [Phycisphaerae bacterium]